MMAENDVMEMAKRGVPSVWIWFLRWLGSELHVFIAHEHNAVGRFYEVESYGPDNRTAMAGPTVTRNGSVRIQPLPSIHWGPRNNTNIQKSAILFALNPRRQRTGILFLENYWLKNKRAVDKGKNGGADV